MGCLKKKKKQNCLGYWTRWRGLKAGRRELQRRVDQLSWVIKDLLIAAALEMYSKVPSQTTGCTRSQVKCGVLEGGGVSGIFGWCCYQALLGGGQLDCQISASPQEAGSTCWLFRSDRFHSPRTPPAKAAKQRKLPAWMFIPTWGNNHHGSFSQSSEFRHRNHFWTNNCTFGWILMTSFRFFDVSVLGGGSWKWSSPFIPDSPPSFSWHEP